MPKMEEIGYWSPKSVLLNFSKFAHYFFLKLYLLLTSFKKWFKVTVLDFQEKFVLYSKREKWFEPRSTVTLYLFLFH